jgi:hypothetical protein
LDLPNQGQERGFSSHFQLVFKLISRIKVVFNGTLGATGYKNHVTNACFIGFFNGILNEGLVHHGQHLFRLCLGGGQEARSKTSHGENRFGQRHLGVGPFCGSCHGGGQGRFEWGVGSMGSVALVLRPLGERVAR